LAESVDWLVKEFDALIKEPMANTPPEEIKATGYLKYEEQLPANEFGRATRGVAMAYKARTLLIAASPLHAASSGVTWAQAAQAALECIEYCDNIGGIPRFELYDGAGERSYSQLFNERYNKEFMFFFNRADANDLYMLLPPRNPWNSNKELSTCPTQWIVDCYDMVDGTPVLDLMNPYNSDYSPNINPAAVALGYDDAYNPYENRDPRFKQTLMHDGMSWPRINGREETVDIAGNEQSGTNYFIVKFLNPAIDHMTGGTTPMNFPMMRYAEVLLNYAEAVNEAGDNADARSKAVEQLNRIRHRAGITTDLVAAEYTQATLRERIRKERRIELAFEEHRFFDIRRWKIAEKVMVLPAYGISRLPDAGNTKQPYRRAVLAGRSYNARMDLLPLPVDEVNNSNGRIWQNPGY
jgi:hypothetical protein